MSRHGAVTARLPQSETARFFHRKQGKTIGEVCRQIKDPQRNGGRSLELLHEHLVRSRARSRWCFRPQAVMAGGRMCRLCLLGSQRIEGIQDRHAAAA